MKTCIFTNDDNVTIRLLDHKFTSSFSRRDNHEVQFRRINTFLIKNNIITNNIIDLGAWVGDNSIPWAKNIKGKVYAIDPSPQNCEFINKMCELNSIDNVFTIQSAISNTNEVLSTNNDLHHCSFVYDNPDNNGSTKVNAVTLDYLDKIGDIENIGYIHLDVEGMEYRILQGSVDIIDKYKPIITFEQHLEIDNYTDILHFLQKRGYSVFLIEEILPGCRSDCRNSIAFPNEKMDSTLISRIHEYLGASILIPKH